MRKTDALFYFCLGIIPVGVILRIIDIDSGNSLFGYGLIGIFIYFSASIIKRITRNEYQKRDLFIRLLIVTITPVIFAKYLYHPFGDYLGLIIIPIFLVSSLINLVSKTSRYLKTSLTSILICILIIPLFDIDFNNDPRNYVPLNWYNRYNVNKSHEIDLSYHFSYKETETLSKQAFEAQKEKNYFKSIYLFKKAISIEPDNPTLHFGMSENYAYTNELEMAKNELDTAINLDNQNPVFYNNRGLLYYKLEENGNAIIDLKKAIELDSTQHIYYCNLALFLNATSEYEEACKMIDKAEALGANIDEYKLLKRIRKKYD
ncbi:hypothetical protein DF185_00300 [Marinifilum breve]|uniref:Uncharacterized protein n=1 Tax=Marinifilum breve TaxID=2184082 RepID=A0A2V4A1F5_9BACT|nr:tetratricopeptide repeat protein [Marinifilum breve]PXY02569.1 hypothetical protein DF185_00300 [Marinifilum breve]